MFLIDLLLDKVANEIKDAPGWLTLIVVCNVLLGWHVVLEPVERLGVDVGNEKALIASLAAIVLFLAGDIVDTLVFPRKKKGAKRWEKIFHSVTLAPLICAFFFFIERNWTRMRWSVAVFAVLWGVLCLLKLWEKRKERRKTEEEKKRGEQTPEPGKNLQAVDRRKDFVGLLKRFQSDNLITERDEAAKCLELEEGEYAVSKSLMMAAGKFKWTSITIYLQNEAGKFLRSLFLPALAVAGFLFYQRHWIYAVFAIAAAPGFLASYFWLKELHMIRLYRLAREIVKTDKTKSAARNYSDFTLPNGRRVFFWNGSLLSSGKAAGNAGSMAKSAR